LEQSEGNVYQLKKIGNDWKSKAIHASPLPQLYIWDIATLLDHHDENIIVVMAGYGSQQSPHSHVWLRKVSEASQEEAWDDISGEGIGRLPDTSINAIEIDPDIPDTIYVGTDIGVFRTTTRGRMWIRFSQGLPNCAVYDMRLHRPTQLLRIVTHGRGIWERKLDEKSMPDVNLFLRHHLMDTGRFTTSTDIPAAFEDPYQNDDKSRSIALGSVLRWDMCADIKVDTPRAKTVKEGETPPLPSYQMNIENVDYVKFEAELYHRDPEQGHVSRVYVQVHNRGIKSAGKEVTVKLFYANAIGNGSDGSIKYPDLPPDFWTSFPHNSFDKSSWKPIGEKKVLPEGHKTLTNTEPTILAWHWNVPPAAADSIALFVVIDSPEDPIPETKKISDIETLVRNERHVGLRAVQIAT
jgi:hypothetical protein